MNSKILQSILIGMLFVCFLSGALAEENQIYNGSFELVDEYGELDGWYMDAYICDKGYSIFQWETCTDAPDGEHYVSIRNEDLNDARYVQTVEVEPESLYHIRFKVRAENVRNGHGANVSVEGLYVFSEGIYDTGGEWQTIDWYGETGEDQNSVTLYIRLGGYSGESLGKASFDEISMEKVDSIPDDLVADRWYQLDAKIHDDKFLDDGNESEELNFFPIILIVLFFVVLFVVRLKPSPSFGALREQEDNIPNNNKLNWGNKDTVLILLITTVYALIAFSTLGSIHAPQNAWVSSSANEEIVIDLGTEYEDFSMLYFARVGRSDFSVEVSGDGNQWSDTFRAEMNQGECYRWKYLCNYWEDVDGNRKYISTGSTTDARKMSGRYVKIISDQIGLPLCEVIFRDGEQQQITGCVIVSQINAVTDSPNYSDASALLDEQDTVEAIPDLFGIREDDTPQPCWYNGTYFDEIYHARTAYEHLHGTVPYETSHPPLGKLIMGLGIMLFGMTPFGWRFTGALAGVLMIPAIYLMIKQLTKRTKFAVIGALLIALDCMHLTQTQIATIDSYPVLFIILSWFFMLRFVQTDIRKTSVQKILPDLAMSGLFMGLGIASKWIGIYSGAGLAVMYFWHGIRCIRCTRNREEKKAVFNKFVRLCLSCILFFALIPTVIYLLCYIPYFAYDKSIRDFPTFLERVIDSQIGMFNYHSQPGLGMDHLFYSPWYEWPIIKKPMYYASGNYISTNDYDSAIFSFGNPAVWFAAIPCFLFGISLLIREHIYRINESGQIRLWHLKPVDHSSTMFFITVGFLAQFLPWVLVPRGTYIYHYFASIPFLILFIVITLVYLDVNFPRIAKLLVAFYLMTVFAFFIGYFPYASGILTPVRWLERMRGLINVFY